MDQPIPNVHLPSRQFSSPQDWLAGNVINDGNGNQPTYDAENRMATDQGYTYSYDSNGVRIEKSNGTIGTDVLAARGCNVLTETDLNGNISEEYVYFSSSRLARIDRPSGTVHYYFSDHLGSASVITDQAGKIQQQYFYFLFGGLVASIGGDSNTPITTNSAPKNGIVNLDSTTLEQDITLQISAVS